MEGLLETKRQEVEKEKKEVERLERIFKDMWEKDRTSDKSVKSPKHPPKFKAYWEIYKEYTNHTAEVQENRKKARLVIERLTLHDSTLTEISDKLPIIEHFIDTTPVGEKHLNHISMQKEVSTMEVHHLSLTRQIEDIQNDLASKDYLEEYRLISEKVKQLREENAILNTTIKNSVNPE